MIEVKVDTATPRSPSSSTNCEKGSTMIGQRTRPHPLDGPAKRGLPSHARIGFLTAHGHYRM